MKRGVQILLSVSIILICLGLSIKLWVEAGQYSCNDCGIKFQNKMAISTEFSPEIKCLVPELFEAFNNGTCLVKWSRTQGYIGGCTWLK